MPDDVGITRISEARDRDGSLIYKVEGGSHTEGETGYYIAREALESAARQGKEALNEVLKRGIRTSLDGRHES